MLLVGLIWNGAAARFRPLTWFRRTIVPPALRRCDRCSSPSHRAYPGSDIAFREGEGLVVRAVALFQINLAIALQSRAGSLAIEIAAGGLQPGGPLRARGSSESIGKAHERLKNDCTCARTSLIQSASADCGYQPWNSFRGCCRAVAPGRRTVCQIHVERRNSRLWLSALEFIPGRPGGCSGQTPGVSDSCGKGQQRARPTGAPPRGPIRHQDQPWVPRNGTLTSHDRAPTIRLLSTERRSFARCPPVRVRASPGTLAEGSPPDAGYSQHGPPTESAAAPAPRAGRA